MCLTCCSAELRHTHTHAHVHMRTHTVWRRQPHTHTHTRALSSYGGWWTKSGTCFELPWGTGGLNWGETSNLTVAFKCVSVCVVWIFSDVRFLLMSTHTHTLTQTWSPACVITAEDLVNGGGGGGLLYISGQFKTWCGLWCSDGS